MKENILGYQVHNIPDLNTIAQKILCENDSNKRWVACFNPHSYVVSLDDHDFEMALKNADYLIPDGIGAVIASKILGGYISSRVTGADVFFSIHDYLENKGSGSVFFLGSSETTLSYIRERMAKDYPSISVKGTFSPPFKNEFSEQDNEEMIDAINNASPDILWVGMTAPKQEKWIHQNLHKLDIKIACAVGAVFDFYAGRVQRSHPIYQKLGLEWLPRLVQEPKRLWKRTFISAPIYMFHLLISKFKPHNMIRD